jgi:transposase InsO family protein
MKKLITDGGGEFCNHTLAEILANKGIQHNVAPLYTPHHNGMAEQANQTIIDMTRCLLLHSKMASE